MGGATAGALLALLTILQLLSAGGVVAAAENGNLTAAAPASSAAAATTNASTPTLLCGGGGNGSFDFFTYRMFWCVVLLSHSPAHISLASCNALSNAHCTHTYARTDQRIHTTIK